jgi:curved DNA-binding protein CbpA
MAAIKRDPYVTLELPRTATLDDIKKRHRTLSRELHPDANVGADQATLRAQDRKLKNVNEAYDALVRELNAAGRSSTRDR